MTFKGDGLEEGPCGSAWPEGTPASAQCIPKGCEEGGVLQESAESLELL